MLHCITRQFIFVGKCFCMFHLIVCSLYLRNLWKNKIGFELALNQHLIWMWNSSMFFLHFALIRIFMNFEMSFMLCGCAIQMNIITTLMSYRYGNRKQKTVELRMLCFAFNPTNGNKYSLIKNHDYVDISLCLH